MGLSPFQWLTVLILFSAADLLWADWPQEAHDPARTGFIAEEPLEPWTLLWTWNGPDAAGGAGAHFYNAPREAHTVTGGSFVYAPAGSSGLYAIAKSNGAQAWRATPAVFNATPAYGGGFVYAGGANGTLYKFDANTGQPLGTYSAGSALNKALLLAGSFIYAVSDDGRLHKVNTSSMSQAWVYSGGAAAATPPAYSASRDLVVFCTDDVFVHAVRNADGTRHWRVKPSPNTRGVPNAVDNTFKGYWPVVADQAGVVFVRMRLNHDAGLWTLPSGTNNRYPTTNSAIRSFLTSNPSLKNLFALHLDDGSEKFIPAVGYGGVEDTVSGGPYLDTGPVPVIKTLSDGKQVAYQMWRNGDVASPSFDTRWDSHLGEMVLDGVTVPGYQAGDLRFVQFVNDKVITDEQCPVTMAGDTLFHAHWGASESARILDRSASRGGSYANPITVQKHPTVIRRQQGSGTPNTTTHWTTTGLSLVVDGRFWPGPGWWVYWNVLDPPTVAASAYSEGILPRYTYVSDGLVIVEGNGGDLFVLRHSGASPPADQVPPASPRGLRKG